MEMGMGRCGQVRVAGDWSAGLRIQPISQLGEGRGKGRRGTDMRVLRPHSEGFLTQGHTVRIGTESRRLVNQAFG